MTTRPELGSLFIRKINQTVTFDHFENVESTRIKLNDFMMIQNRGDEISTEGVWNIKNEGM